MPSPVHTLSDDSFKLHAKVLTPSMVTGTLRGCLSSVPGYLDIATDRSVIQEKAGVRWYPR